jgi:predicted transcriptional regulator
MARRALIIYIEDADRKILDRIAKEEDRSVSAVARRMIENRIAYAQARGRGKK